MTSRTNTALPGLGPSVVLRDYDGMQALACETGRGRRLVLLATQGHERLDAIAEAHERVTSPYVARVEARGESGTYPYLSFDCDAVSDMETLAAAISLRNEKIPYAAAIAFNEFMMDSVERAHLDGAVFFGALGWRNFLVGPTGRLWLFGLGANFPIARADGVRSNGSGIVEAPESLLGVAANAASDVYVLHATLRSLLPYVDLLPMFAEARGRADARGAAIYAALGSLGAEALATDPSHRLGSVAALRERYRGIRQLVPEMPVPDTEALASSLVALLPPSEAPYEISVATAARTLIVDGSLVDLSERGIKWRIVSRLVEAHASERAVPLEELASVGWPREKVLPEASRARVYVVISELRKTALGPHLLKRDDGYFLAPGLRIQIAP